MQKLKYSSYTITCQEVPDEVSLVINISGCPHRCEGCHSDYLRKYSGEYLLENLDYLIEQYSGLISCVCFMGGDQSKTELLQALKQARALGYKTCVYSGIDDESYFSDILSELDYLKVGKYIEHKGGLSSQNTNQKFYSICNDKKENITYRFWEEEK